ncbi:MAG: hypothetical protein KAS32_01355 [Candidatus Peribacteraceae bacterium]|nr:hypothetical protein [Candidatus Peribacteraceae bacterium]
MPKIYTAEIKIRNIHRYITSTIYRVVTAPDIETAKLAVEKVYEKELNTDIFIQEAISHRILEDET